MAAIKKKKFFDVEMPILKKTTQLYAYNIEALNNRIIKYDLTRILKGKGSLMNLKVEVKDEKATSIPIEIKFLPSFLKRIVRKSTNYIEDSFVAECKNGKLRIKPLLVTRRRVNRNVKKALREKTKEELTNYVKNKKYEEIFKDILKNKIQKEISLRIKKIYPLSAFEIRILKVISSDNSEKN